MQTDGPVLHHAEHVSYRAIAGEGARNSNGLSVQIGSIGGQQEVDEQLTQTEDVGLDSEERRQLDAHAMGDHISNTQALMNLLKGNIGTGMLAMPIIIKYAGLWTGVLFIMIMGLIATYMMHLLLRCARDVRDRFGLDRSKLDYTETVFNVFKYGPEPLRRYKGKFKHTVNVFLIITQIGFCCVYCLFASQNIQKFIEYFAPPSTGSSLPIIGLCVTILLVPLSLIKNMRLLAVFSTFANVATLLGIILIFAYCFTGIQDYSQFPAITNFSDFLIAFGIIIYSFESISLVLPIENKMSDPEAYPPWNGVLNTGMVLVVVLYTAMGFFGFLRFGEQTEGSITFSIPIEPYWFSPVKPLFVFAIIISYLLQFYIPAIIFSRLMEKLACHRVASDKRRKLHLIAMRILLVAFTYGVAMLIPHLDLMISLIGSLSSSTLALILPPLLDTVNRWHLKSSIPNFWITVVTKNMLFTLFGVIGFVGGTISTLIQIVHVFKTE